MPESPQMTRRSQSQLSDVEDEVNGLFTPDWQYKADAEEMRALNAALYAAFGDLFSKG